MGQLASAGTGQNRLSGEIQPAAEASRSERKERTHRDQRRARERSQKYYPAVRKTGSRNVLRTQLIVLPKANVREH